MADINQAPKIQNGGYKPEVAISEQPYMIDRLEIPPPTLGILAMPVAVKI